MRELVYFRAGILDDPDVAQYPGIKRFRRFAKSYGSWVIPVDRTNTVVPPIRTSTLYTIPLYRKFTNSYEQVCDERAKTLLKKASDLGVRIKVMYSGGIDSTCLMVSLLKHATTEQKRNIIVLLSRDSIIENPRFYEEHIRGKFETESSVSFASMIGGSDMLLSAEHNDMVMGAAQIGALMNTYEPSVIHRPYDRDLLTEFFTNNLKGDADAATLTVDTFERICGAAPIPIETNFDVLWWITFVTKWQACFAYMLLFTHARNADKLTREYISSRFISFYNCDEFQLWSMNNLDKRIKDTWKTYKWVAKEIIYKYTKDAEYRDHKTKVRSLPIVIFQQYLNYSFLDKDIKLLDKLPPEEYIRERNDFV